MNGIMIPQESPALQPPAARLGDIVGNTGLEADAEAAIRFLQSLDREGRHNLVAIDPATGMVEGRTFEPGRWTEIRQWVEDRNGRRNLYFSANEPRAGAPNKKLGKADIENVRCLYADTDPQAGTPLQEERERLFRDADSLGRHKLAPTWTIDSGGGVQHVWKLSQPLSASEHKSTAEAQGRAIADWLDGDKVQDISRILRLPGTLNLPTEEKRQRGRSVRPAAVISSRAKQYSLEEFAAEVAPVATTDKPETDSFVAEAFDDIDMASAMACTAYEDLPAAVRHRFEAACQSLSALSNLWAGEPSALIGADHTGSGWRASLARRMGEAFDVDFDAHDYACLAACWPHGQGRRELNRRELAREWGKFAAPVIEERRQLINRYFEAVPVQSPSEITASDAPAAAKGLVWIDPREWIGVEPAKREWEVENWIPRGEVTFLYGDGGVGKTLLAHQYATAAAAGVPWMGQNTRQARVMCFFCEDDAKELHRRQIDINSQCGLQLEDISSSLRIVSRKNEINLLGVWKAKSEAMTLTPLWHELRRDARKFGADVIILDTLTDIFGGNDLDRSHANTFVKACLGRLAADIGGSVIVLAHPSASGKSSGEGTAGSTQWNNAVRSRLYLEQKGTKGGNTRRLSSMKLNYGPKGSELHLEWRRGAFVVTAGRMTASAPDGMKIPTIDNAVEDAVLTAVLDNPGTRMARGKTSPYFAPKQLKRLAPDVLSAFPQDEIGEAIDRLEKRGVIRLEEVGRTSSRHAVEGYIVVTDKLSESSETCPAVFD